MIANTLIAVFGTAIVGFTSVTCYLGYKAAQRSYYNMTIPHPQLIINNVDATNPKVYQGIPKLSYMLNFEFPWVYVAFPKLSV